MKFELAVSSHQRVHGVGCVSDRVRDGEPPSVEHWCWWRLEAVRGDESHGWSVSQPKRDAPQLRSIVVADRSEKIASIG